MSVSNIAPSTGVGLNQTNWRSTVKQGKQDFSQLLGALQSGDMQGAQQAYSAMQQLLPGIQAAAQTSAGAVGNAVTTDFSALGAALSSGSLSGAQDAVTKLQQDAQAYRQGSNTFGSLEHAEGIYKSMQRSATSSASANSSAGSDTTLNTDMTALGQALQSGNISSAQDAYAKLQQDLLSTQQGQGVGRHHHHHHAASGSQNPISSYLANSVLGSTATTANSAGSSSQTASGATLASVINSANSSLNVSA
jgi:hypothetical protein